MKKRILILLLVLILVLCACDQKHVHDFSAEYACDDTHHWLACECGEQDSYGEHSWNKGTVTLQPTTESEGERTFTCTVCRSRKTETIDKLSPDHVHVYDILNSDENHHWNECVCGEVEEKVEHDWNNSVVTLQPTTENEGERTFTCAVCQTQKTEKIDKLPPSHTHAYDLLNSDGSHHWNECACGEVKGKAAHSWDEGTVTKEATQTAKGEKRYACTVCGRTRTEDIAVLVVHDHTYSEVWSTDGKHHWHSATCEHTGEVIDKAAHTWDEGTVTKPATGSETGIRKYTCSVCAYELEIAIPATSAKGLSFSAGSLRKIDEKLSSLPLTIEADVYLPEKYAERAGVIFGNYAGSRKNLNFEIQKNGVPRFYYTDTNNKDQSILFNKVDIRTGDWVHLAISFDYANRTISLYLNGELAESVACTADMIPAITDVGFVLGGDNRSGNGQYFKGEIRSLAVYSTVRTAEEIKKDRETGIDFFDEELLLCYFVGENDTGKAILDLSSNGNHISTEWYSDEKVELDYAYSFAVVGDTQVLCQKYPEKMETIYDWLIANKDSKKIAHVFGLGDITEEWGNAKSEAEWIKAQQYISKLDGVLPYSLVRGNHDETSFFQKYFANKTYMSQFDGFMIDGDIRNAYKTFTAGSTDYMVFTLDYGPSDEALAWANEVIASHPNHKVIITTHCYLFRDGTTLSTGDITPPNDGSDVDSSPLRSYNDGQQMWEKLVSKHPNIVLVMSGHDPCEDIVTLQSQGAHGSVVTQMLIDPQGMDAAKGGTAMVCMLYFSKDGTQMEVEWYSVDKEQYYKNKNQFTLDLSGAANESHAFVDTYNETHHYRVCDCGYTYDKEAHAFDGGVLNADGFMVYTCACGYQRIASATNDPVAKALQSLLEKYYNGGDYYEESVVRGAAKTAFYQKDKFWIGNDGYGSANGKLTRFTVLENGIFGAATEQSGKPEMEAYFLTLHDFVLGSYKGEFTGGKNLRLDLGWNEVEGVYTSVNAETIEGVKLLVADDATIGNLTKVTVEEADHCLLIKLWSKDSVAAEATIGYYATTSFNTLGGETLAVLYTKAGENGLCSVTAPALNGYVAEYDRYAVSADHNELSNTVYCSAVSVWDGKTVSSGLSGAGTKEDPFLIKSAADFAYLRSADSAGKYFKLMTSIDLDGHAFSIDSFSGALDGNHCSVRGLNLSNKADNTGLFKELGADSYVCDLSLYGTVSGQKYTGALAGATNGRVVNVVNFATVSGAGNLGGVTGNAKPNSSVEGCANYGEVNGTSWNNGGVVGFAQNQVVNCANYGTVTTTGDCAGGVVGTAHSKVIGCINYGVVNASGRAGGVVYNSKSIVDSCINYGTVNGGWDLGGVLGYVAKDCSATVSNCVNYGKVNGNTGIGGIFGFSEPSATLTIIGCVNNGEVNATWGGGGIAGNTNAEISRCVNNGKVNGLGELGGIVGKAYGKITECTNNGIIVGKNDIIGGIIGHLHDIKHLTAINTTNKNNGAVSGPNSKDLIGKADGVIAANDNIVGINHRGWYEAPENTLSAYRESSKHGFKYVECDVQFTKDGVPVLLHDDTIDRTSNGSGTVSKMTYSELLKYDFSYDDNDKTVDFTAYRGEKIPTFEEFIALCKELGLHPYVEIKGSITNEQVKQLIQIVADAGLLNDVSWLSFSGDALAKIAANCNTARIVWVITEVDAAELAKTHVPFAEKNLKTGKNQVVFDLWYSLAKQDVVDLLKEHNIPLEVWTVNDTSVILGLNPYVTGVTSDKYNAGQVVKDAKAGN